MYETINIIIFHLQLYKRWAKILKKWNDQSSIQHYCTENVSQDLTCFMNDWFCECSCQSDFKCFKMRLINELTLFLIFLNNVNNWFNELKIIINLKALKIEFTVVHNIIVELNHIMIIIKVNRIRTIHDDSDENIKLSKIKSCDQSKQHDKSSKKSTLMFILTTW